MGGVPALPGDDISHLLSDECHPARKEPGSALTISAEGEIRVEDFGIKWKPRMVGGRWDPIGRPERSWRGRFVTPICGAIASSTGKPCMRQPVVNSKGEWGRCYVHGGRFSLSARTLRNLDRMNPSTAAQRLRKRMEELSEDGDLASIEKQVGLAAASLEEYVRLMEEEGVQHLSEEDVERLVRLVDRLSKITERRHKIREGQLVRVQYQLIDTMAQAVVKVVNDALRKHLSAYPELWEAVVSEITSKLRAFDWAEKAS